MTLYDADRCPYCARVRLVLAEKGVPHETVVVDLDDRPAWIYEKNATGRVPVLEEDAFVLPESDVICEYLEERYPEPALLPADPAERALARLRDLPLRRPARRRLLRAPARRGRRGRPARRAARRPRRGARGAAVPHGPRVRARRRRVPAMGAAGARAARASRSSRSRRSRRGSSAASSGRRSRPSSSSPARGDDRLPACAPARRAHVAARDGAAALRPRPARWRSGRARSWTRSRASSCSSAPRWAATARSRRPGSRRSACAGSRSSARAPRRTRPSGARAARRRSRRSTAAAPQALWEDMRAEAVP